MKPQIIAYYLPQFYPFKENDEWWGKGFTEWTNVGKAMPLWKGHYQPHVPADLGYYDLRVPEVREQQAELAREAGVTAFCYWHYWFGKDKRLLERVFDEVLESGKPNFPFCLGWANHSWFAKTWNKDVTKDKLLVEQTYSGIEDAKLHFDYLLKAFKDPRYVKIDGKPFFLIFDVNSIPNDYLEWFRTWAKEAGFPNIYIVGNVPDVSQEKTKILAKGFDALVYNRVSSSFHYNYYMRFSFFKRKIYLLRKRIKTLFYGIPMNALDYNKFYPFFVTDQEREDDILPQMVPQWDHSPRSNNKASVIFYNSSPKSFYNHARICLNMIKKKPKTKQIIILKSWNEWAEGNYMEPDLLNKKGFIKSLRKAIKDVYGA